MSRCRRPRKRTGRDRVEGPSPDLTALSRKNGGVFPSDHIQAVLKFGVETPAHGSADMPIWGILMQTLSKNSQDSDLEVYQRIVNLTSYLKQIQK